MGAFIIRRLLQMLVVLFIVSLIAFSLLHIIPGDPVLTMLGNEASLAQIENTRRELGLDQPPPLQYVRWFGNLLQGDFGKSIAYRGEPVASLIATRLPVTFHLGLVAFTLSALLGIPAGILSAVRRGSWLDTLLTLVSNLGMAIPIFWLGILGIYVFALQLAWLPVQGYTSPLENFWLNTRQLIMPALCLAVTPLAALTRLTRSSMLEVMRQDYIRTAHAKGLRERVVLARHALKNAIIPIVTLSGLQLRNLVGGSVLVEQVFNIPGMGRLMVSSVFNKDFVVVQGGVIMLALVVMLSNLIVDISYGYLDPRIRHQG
jgi:peptide/nickel transport system permease protein